MSSSLDWEYQKAYNAAGLNDPRLYGFANTGAKVLFNTGIDNLSQFQQNFIMQLAAAGRNTLGPMFGAQTPASQATFANVVQGLANGGPIALTGPSGQSYGMAYGPGNVSLGLAQSITSNFLDSVYRKDGTTNIAATRGIDPASISKELGRWLSKQDLGIPGKVETVDWGARTANELNDKIMEQLQKGELKEGSREYKRLNSAMNHMDQYDKVKARLKAEGKDTEDEVLVTQEMKKTMGKYFSESSMQDMHRIRNGQARSWHFSKDMKKQIQEAQDHIVDNLKVMSDVLGTQDADAINNYLQKIRIGTLSSASKTEVLKQANTIKAAALRQGITTQEAAVQYANIADSLSAAGVQPTTDLMSSVQNAFEIGNRNKMLDPTAPDGATQAQKEMTNIIAEQHNYKALGQLAWLNKKGLLSDTGKALFERVQNTEDPNELLQIANSEEALAVLNEASAGNVDNIESDQDFVTQLSKNAAAHANEKTTREKFYNNGEINKHVAAFDKRAGKEAKYDSDGNLIEAGAFGTMVSLRDKLFGNSLQARNSFNEIVKTTKDPKELEQVLRATFGDNPDTLKDLMQLASLQQNTDKYSDFIIETMDKTAMSNGALTGTAVAGGQDLAKAKLSSFAERMSAQQTEQNEMGTELISEAFIKGDTDKWSNPLAYQMLDKEQKEKMASFQLTDKQTIAISPEALKQDGALRDAAVQVFGQDAVDKDPGAVSKMLREDAVVASKFLEHTDQDAAVIDEEGRIRIMGTDERKAAEMKRSAILEKFGVKATALKNFSNEFRYDSERGALQYSKIVKGKDGKDETQWIDIKDANDKQWQFERLKEAKDNQEALNGLFSSVSKKDEKVLTDKLLNASISGNGNTVNRDQTLFSTSWLGRRGTNKHKISAADLNNLPDDEKTIQMNGDPAKFLDEIARAIGVTTDVLVKAAQGDQAARNVHGLNQDHKDATVGGLLDAYSDKELAGQIRKASAIIEAQKAAERQRAEEEALAKESKEQTKQLQTLVTTTTTIATAMKPKDKPTPTKPSGAGTTPTPNETATK